MLSLLFLSIVQYVIEFLSLILFDSTVWFACVVIIMIMILIIILSGKSSRSHL